MGPRLRGDVSAAGETASLRFLPRSVRGRPPRQPAPSSVTLLLRRPCTLSRTMSDAASGTSLVHLPSTIDSIRGEIVILLRASRELRQTCRFTISDCSRRATTIAPRDRQRKDISTSRDHHSLRKVTCDGCQQRGGGQDRFPTSLNSSGCLRSSAFDVPSLRCGGRVDRARANVES